MSLLYCEMFLAGKFVLKMFFVLRFQAITRFKGFEHEDDQNLIEEPATSGLRFAGKNVLEGIRDLLDDKSFSKPLPKFIETLPVAGTNDFTIREKL